MPSPSFDGLRVLILESRRAKEMATLVSTYGGQPLSAPALREVPLESNTEALAFVDAVVRGEVDIVVLQTGVGLRAILDVVDALRNRDTFVAALGRTKIVARGPKPIAVLRELKIVPWVSAAEPNTWREVLAALDGKADEQPLRGTRVALQEYGASNLPLFDGLRARGAQVTRVPVYRYSLPDDIEPLRAAVTAVARGELHVAIFTTATQVVHLLLVAETMQLADAVRRELHGMVVASIGPTTSEGLREQGLAIDLEASHPKMGFLVREAAARSADVLQAKRGGLSGH